MAHNVKINESAQGLAVLSHDSFTIDRQHTEKPGNAHAYHYHNAYEIYYLFSGDRYYFIKDKTYHAKRGSLVLIKPYEIHCASNFSEEPYERMLISFKKNFLSEMLSGFSSVNFFKCFDEDVHIVEFPLGEESLIESLLNAMHEEYKKETEASKCFIKTALSELLLLSLKYSEKEGAVEVYQDAVRKTMSLVAAYINNNYSDDLSLSSLAKRFFISPCYLSRSFKRITGNSLVDYVNGVRIKEAQRLLRKTALTVSEIALSVGFKSTTHFGRAFKSTVGISPLAYRKG